MPTRTFEFEGLRAVVEDQGYHPQFGTYIFWVSVEAPTGKAHRGHIITGGQVRPGPPGRIGRPWKQDYAFAAYQAIALMRVLLDLGVEGHFRKTVRSHGIYERAQQAKTLAKIEDSWEVAQDIGPGPLEAALTELEPLAKLPPGSTPKILEEEKTLKLPAPVRFGKTFKGGYDLPLPPGMEHIQEAALKVKAGEMDWEQFRGILRREILYMGFVHPSQVDETVDQVMEQVAAAIETMEEAGEVEVEEEEGPEMGRASLGGLEELPGWEELDLFMV